MADFDRQDKELILIPIDKVTEEGFPVDTEIAVEDMGFSEMDDLVFIEPLKVKGDVRKFDDILLLEADLHTRIKTGCMLCLRDIERDWSKHLTLDFPLDLTQEFIEVGEDLRQETILNLPMRIKCDDVGQICDEETKSLVNRDYDETEYLNKPESDEKYKPFENM